MFDEVHHLHLAEAREVSYFSYGLISAATLRVQLFALLQILIINQTG